MLVKLYEVTGGKDSESVDFKELVKKEGFLPSYTDIFQHLSRQGWITETGRGDIVRITHWGVKEANKSNTSSSDGLTAIKKDANRLQAEIKELLVMSEELSNMNSLENYDLVKNKFYEIKEIIDHMKSNF